MRSNIKVSDESIMNLDSYDNTNPNEKNEFQVDNLVKVIPPAKWEGLLNVLNFLTKDSNDSIIIKNSTILCGYKGGSIIRANLSEIFEGDDINLHISSPKRWTKLFHALKDGKIYIIDDENKFIVTNEQIKLFLPKQLNSIVNTLEFPSFENTEIICDLIIQKDTRDTVLKLGNGFQYLEFLLKSGFLKCISIPNTAIYILPEYIKDDEAQNLTTLNSDLTLRTQVFLPYPSDTYKVIIGRNLLNDSYFIYTMCKTSLINIEIYEQLDNASGLDQLF